MKKLKKILLISGISIAVIAIILFLLNSWIQDYSVEIAENIEIPLPSRELPPVIPDSTGWPSWKGMTNNNHSAFTDIQTDWSNGLDLLWNVDYLNKGDKSIGWSCPAISGNHLVPGDQHVRHGAAVRAPGLRHPVGRGVVQLRQPVRQPGFERVQAAGDRVFGCHRLVHQILRSRQS